MLPNLGMGLPAGERPVASGADLDAVTAMLGGLSVDELAILSQRIKVAVKSKRSRTAVIKSSTAK